MKQCDIDNIIYFMQFEYRDNGYTDRLDREIRLLTMDTIYDKVLRDKELLKLL